jgi:hypothetical protein
VVACTVLSTPIISTRGFDYCTSFKPLPASLSLREHMVICAHCFPRLMRSTQAKEEAASCQQALALFSVFELLSIHCRHFFNNAAERGA